MNDDHDTSLSGAPVGIDKSGSRASASKGARRFQMPVGRFRSPEGEGRGQVVWVLGIGDGYAGCCQTRAVEEGKDEGSVGTEGGHNKCAGCMGGGIRALGGTRRMG